MQHIPNGFAWYWENYKIADAWRKQHLLAMNSNESSVSQMCQSLQNTLITPDYMEQEEYFEEDQTSQQHDCELSDNEIEFEISDEMILFLEQSIRHKMELKQQRELEKQKRNSEKIPKQSKHLLKKDKKSYKKHSRVNKKDEHNKEGSENPLDCSTNHQKRIEEMTLLYGEDAAPMICGMETAMQLNFNRICDRKSPAYWPNISFQI